RVRSAEFITWPTPKKSFLTSTRTMSSLHSTATDAAETGYLSWNGTSGLGLGLGSSGYFHVKSFHTCEVAENYRIPCGTNEISASECDAINCCFDGLMLTLQCTKEGLFIVVGARDATLPNTDLETISFYENGHSCNPVGSTSAFAIYEFPVTACGAVVKEEPGVLIYENRMSSLYQVITGPHGSITRDTYNDCPCRDDRYLTTLLPRPSFGFKFPSHHNCFVFKMFHFVGDGSSTQSLYIHCDVAICQPTLGNNCEPRCFRKSKLYTDTISTVFPGV
uniref:Zona pellucida sperm-binding protein 4 n=1 Tax=Pundamilia nyererei TaxID=303518 RepID=A0A3B4F8A9_9CICH